MTVSYTHLGGPASYARQGGVIAYRLDNRKKEKIYKSMADQLLYAKRYYGMESVSYTHLDVYKRQVEGWISRELLENYPDISLNPDSIERLHPMLRPMLMYNATVSYTHLEAKKSIPFY